VRHKLVGSLEVITHQLIIWCVFTTSYIIRHLYTSCHTHTHTHTHCFPFMCRGGKYRQWEAVVGWVYRSEHRWILIVKGGIKVKVRFQIYNRKLNYISVHFDSPWPSTSRSTTYLPNLTNTALNGGHLQAPWIHYLPLSITHQLPLLIEWVTLLNNSPLMLA
jgi:hypothetical protein